MPDHLQLARAILQELLVAGPIKGAKLKPQLVRQFELRTGMGFRGVFPDYLKFSDFLSANKDLVDVTPPQGQGDITVQLKGNHVAAPRITWQAGNAPVSFELPRPLWQAFTNPDPDRRRFFNRETRDVVHYIEDSSEEPNPRIRTQVRDDPNFVEIEPAGAELQKEWMREFVRDAGSSWRGCFRSPLVLS